MTLTCEWLEGCGKAAVRCCLPVRFKNGHRTSWCEDHYSRVHIKTREPVDLSGIDPERFGEGVPLHCGTTTNGKRLRRRLAAEYEAREGLGLFDRPVRNED